MIKKNVLTVIGIILSFAIAGGGWVATSWLIDMESYRLLSGTTSFVVDIPIVEITYLNDENDYPNIRLGLTDSEIISVLKNWELTDYRRPHEPASGQIDMEQAIEAGRAALTFLYNHHILPAGILEFSHVGAILSQNVPQGEAFLPLMYSYWTVTFRNDNMLMFMTINAVTGRVWNIEAIVNVNARDVVMQPLGLSTGDGGLMEILDAFMFNLQIRPDDETEQETVGAIIAAFSPDWATHTRMHFGISSLEVYAVLGAEVGYTPVMDTVVAAQSFADGDAAAIISATGILIPNGILHFHRINVQLVAL